MNKYISAALGVCLFSTAAQSADITSSFYIPTKTVMSNTTETTTLAVNADYQFNDKLALGLRTTYLLDKEVHKKTTDNLDKYDNYTVGINLKYLF